MKDEKNYKRTIYLPDELSHKIQDDDVTFLTFLYELDGLKNRYRYHTPTQDIVTFYCMKFQAPKCLQYMLNVAGEKENNYKSMFQVLIPEEKHTAFYYGFNLLEYFHRPGNRYFELLGQTQFESSLARCAAYGKKKVFTHLLNEYIDKRGSESLLKLYNENGQRLLDILFDNKALESMKVFIEKLLPLDRTKLFYYINGLHLESGVDPYLNRLSFFQKYCKNTQSNYEGIQAYQGSINKKQKINELAYSYLKPIFDRIYEEPDFAGLMASIAAHYGSNFVLQNMPRIDNNPSLYIALRAIRGHGPMGAAAELINSEEHAFQYPNRYMLYLPYLNQKREADMQEFYPYSAFIMKKHTMLTEQGTMNRIEHNKFIHDWFSLSRFQSKGSILGTLALKNDWTSIDSYGNTHLHILCEQILNSTNVTFKQSRSTYLRFFKDLFEWQPELFLVKNNEGDRPVDYIQLFEPYMNMDRALLEEFKDMLSKFAQYESLQRALPMTDSKTKRVKI